MSRKTTLFTLILMMASMLSYGQVWSTVGSGVQSNWGSSATFITSTSSNGLLYVAYYDPTANPVSAVKSWDGLTWTSYAAIPNTNFKVSDIVIAGDTIFLTGSGGPALYGFKGNTWFAVSPPGFSGSTSTVEVVNGDLVVGGDFTATGINDLFKYDGTTFSAYFATTNSIERVDDIHFFNGEIYIGAKVPAGGTAGLLKHIGGTSWDQPAHYYQGTSTSDGVFSLVEYQNKIYVADRESEAALFELGSDTLHFKGKISHSFVDYAVLNGEAYFVGDTPTTTASLTRFDGTTLTRILSSPSNLVTAEAYESQLYAFSTSQRVYYGNRFNYSFRTSGNFAILKGTTFLDENNDCVMNGAEKEQPYTLLHVGTNILTSGDNGEFNIGLAPGTYSFGRIYIPTVEGKNIIQFCSLPASLTLSPNQVIDRPIALNRRFQKDLGVKVISAWRARFGFDEFCDIKVSNMGIDDISQTTLTVEVPPSLSVLSSQPAPNTINGNTLTYDIYNLESIKSSMIRINFNVDTSANKLGDTLEWKTHLSALAGEVDPSDNADTLSQIVTGAYDPNDKQASASQVALGTEKIDYHIRFQNTGSDTAIKVTVIDTLDLSLPATKVVINATSHPYALTVQNNILAWEFDHIMLPDSATDPAGSQGYINFTVGLNPSLGVGDTVDNDAEIYFDYQPPVHTNHAKTIIVKPSISLNENPLSELLEVYPNPANDELIVESAMTETIIIEMLDCRGAVVRKLEARPFEKQSVSVGDLATGVYYLKAPGVSRKIIIADF